MAKAESELSLDVSQFTSSLKKAVDKQKEANETTKKFTETNKKLKKQVDETSASLGKEANKFKENKKQADEATDSLGEATEKTDKFNKKMKESSGINLGSSLKKIAKVGLAIGAIGAAGVTKGANALKDFQLQMNTLEAVSGATSKEMSQAEQVIMDLGAKTKFSGTEVAEAAVNFARAGFSMKETVEALPGAVNVALAANLDLATSVSITADTLKKLELSGADAVDVADKLAKGANSANTDMLELSEGLKTGLPVMKSYGFGIDETASLLLAFTEAGFKGTEAGTALKQMFGRMKPVTKEAAKLMEQYGIDVFDAQGKMKGLPDIMDQYGNALSKMTDEQKLAFSQEVFGQEAGAKLTALFSKGSKDFLKFSEIVKKAGGSSAKAAETMNKGVVGPMEEMTSAIESAWIGVGKNNEQEIKNFAKAVSDAAPAIENLFGGVLVVLTGIVNALKEANDLMNTLAGNDVKPLGPITKEEAARQEAKEKAIKLLETGPVGSSVDPETERMKEIAAMFANRPQKQEITINVNGTDKPADVANKVATTLANATNTKSATAKNLR